MEVVKTAAEIFREFGAGNTALFVVLALFCYIFIWILPKAVERVVVAVECLGKTFAVHDERSQYAYQNQLSLQADLKALLSSAATRADIEAFHVCLDNHSKECQQRGSDLRAEVARK